jgi:hypothetical protein
VEQTRRLVHQLSSSEEKIALFRYADLNVPMLARMFDRRCRGYEAVGYAIVLPASAIPGWPADVTLPADPLWKRDYAASVRRLVRDGVDAPRRRPHGRGSQATTLSLGRPCPWAVVVNRT